MTDALLAVIIGCVAFAYRPQSQFIWFKAPDFWAHLLDSLIPFAVLGCIAPKQTDFRLSCVISRRIQPTPLKLKAVPFALTALGILSLTACQDDILECDDKATIVIANNTLCTPEVEVNGDLYLEMNPLNSVEYAADAGTYDLRAKMALISVCVDSEETFNTECGETYRFEIN